MNRLITMKGRCNFSWILFALRHPENIGIYGSNLHSEQAAILRIAGQIISHHLEISA